MRLFKMVFLSEVIKVKNTFALFLLVFIASSIPLFVTMEYFKHSDKVMITGVNPWMAGWKRTIIGVSIFAGPCTAIMLTALLMNIEHKANAWKNIFTLPVSPGIVYINKLIVNLLLLIFFYFLFSLLFLICGLIIGMAMPESGFLQQVPEFSHMLKIGFRSFVALLAMFSVHFWLSFRLKNIFINMAIGLMLIFFAMMTYPQMEKVLYFPYNYGELTVFKTYSANDFLAKHEICSIIIFLSVLVLSYLDFTKRFKG